MNGVGFLVVTYNSGVEIGPCLDAVLRLKQPDDTVLVVDNASQDCTVDEVRKRGVSLAANPDNRGFAAAVNQGVRILEKDLILLLNPDVILRTGIGPMCGALSDPKAAGAGGRLLDAEGHPQAGFMVRRLPTVAALAFEVLLLNRLWPRNPVNWNYRCMDIDLNRSAKIEQPAGALFLFRKSVWEQLDGFDEQFFPLWFEDVDFCLRARNLGYYMYYVPAAEALHSGGHSLRQISVERRQLYWYGGLLTYAVKHFRGWRYRLLCLAVLTGSIARAGIGAVARLSFKPIRENGKVALLAGRRLLQGRPAGTG
jgi:N-acetylglucosaminyl-diphospho-decaprenol L-rhamnosyltransferase